jgi:hypothetical protein
MPLHMFSMIYKLHLYNISNYTLNGLSGEIKRFVEIRPLRKLLSSKSCNIHTLELSVCRSLQDISEVPKLLKLKNLSISCCHGIVDLSFLKNIEEVHILDCRGVKDYSNLSGSNQKSVTIFTTSDVISSISQFHRLTSLSVTSRFDHSDLFIGFDSNVCNLKNLNLHQKCYSITKNCLQLLTLQSLDLNGFDCSSWNQTFPLLNSVSLSNCNLPTNLICF